MKILTKKLKKKLKVFSVFSKLLKTLQQTTWDESKGGIVFSCYHAVIEFWAVY